MVRQDSEMFKIHPESQCVWRAGDPLRGDAPWAGDAIRSYPDDVTIPQYPVAPMNVGLDKKLDIIINLLGDIKKALSDK